ncbi:hypothetical protein OPKNFCMD_2151 [Methylobacterium crusticola]|uniref:MFS transporter n=2 Tax=Methylobacterium crusticola TaxID=1697972 RepID=A0ABQ4QWI8_9HYPH|nr:hypothetical protein OPKNFCMD_2151 [Methylobacterium crusticola]
MIPLVMSALIGGPLTTALLWGAGHSVAFAAAPLGGSVCAFLAACCLGLVNQGAARAVPVQRRASAHFGPTWHARVF